MGKDREFMAEASEGGARAHKGTPLEELERRCSDLEVRNRELHEALERIDRSRQEYGLLFEYAPVGYFVLTPNGFITEVNAIGASLLDRRRDELIGRNFSLFVAPPFKETCLTLLQKASDTGRKETCELQLQGVAQAELYVQIDIWCSEDQIPPSCRIAVTDIRGLKQAEKQLRESRHRLRESEGRFRAIMEQSADALALTESGRYIEANPAFQRLVGYSEEELKNMTVHDIVAHSREEIEANEKTVLSKGVQLLGERNYRRKDGSTVAVEANLTAIRLRDRTIVSHLARDITARKMAQEEMLRLHSALEQSGEGVIIMDREARVQYVNQAFARMTGYLAPDLKGRLWTGLETLEEGDGFYERVKTTLRETGSWSGRMKGSRKDRTAFDADVTITTIRNQTGEAVGLVAVARDVTEELQAEKQMIQLQKMEAIGTATGGIAHDFNNMLAAVIGNIELALDDMPEELPTRSNMEQALAAALRGRDLVRKLLTFSRRGERKVSGVHLGRVVEDTYQLLRVTIPKTVEIRVSAATGDDEIRADPVEIQQVLMNLCTNAADAIGEKGGVIEIGVGKADLKQNDRRLQMGLSPGEHVVLSVRDTGKGIAEEVRQRMFEPFFTTKPEGKGTGMGLAVVYGIVQNYRGAIIVESRIDQGSCFAIYLPAAEKDAGGKA